MRSSQVNAGDTGTIGQYNKLRDDAYASSMLLAHEQSTPDLTVYVEAGKVYINGTLVEYAGGNSPSFTAPATNPRIDVLSINSSGTLVRTAGTEAASPVAPSVPSGEMPICQVYNKVGQTQIYDTDQGASKGYIYKDIRSFLTLPKVQTIQSFTTTNSDLGSSTTRFDITNPAGTTFRYTWDGTGTDPAFSAANNPVGSSIEFNCQNFTAANNGLFLVTGSGTNYVEVTNASGVAENDKTIGTGYVVKQSVWTKPAGLRYAVVELVGAGGGGGGANVAGSEGGNGGSGGGGGYAKKIIQGSSLGSIEAVGVGKGGSAGASSGGDGGAGRTSRFGSHVSASGGNGGDGTTTEPIDGGVGGIGSSGDINIRGGSGSGGHIVTNATRGAPSSAGGNSLLGGGGKGVGRGGTGAGTNGGDGGLYGGGGGGGTGDSSGDASGGAGAQGVVIVTEYYF